MKPKEITAIEKYIKTDNEYWNEFAFKMLCEVLKNGNFENNELPLKIIDEATDIFIDNSDEPLKAVNLFAEIIEKNKLTTNQKYFVYEWIYKYLNESDFEEVDLTSIKDLIKSQKEKLFTEIEPLKPLTKNIRESLKEVMQKELEKLPDTLKKLEPVQRLNILCKLIPFILPKVESIDHEQDEPKENNLNGFKW